MLPMPTMPAIAYGHGLSDARIPEWLRSELERQDRDTPLDSLLGAGLRMRHLASNDLIALRDLLEGRLPPLDPVRQWFVSLSPRQLRAIDDQAHVRCHWLADGLVRLRQDCDLDDPEFVKTFMQLGRERDRLEGVRVLLAWRQSEADRNPEQIAERQRQREVIVAAKRDKLARLRDKHEGRPLERRWPEAPRPLELPRVELIQVSGLNRALRELDTAMLAWLESLHRHPHIDDAWLQAVAELDPLAWWGSWSDGEARR